MPVRDVVFAMDTAEAGLTAHSVVDGKPRWHAPGPVAAAGIVTMSDALVAAVDKQGNVMTFVASSGEARWSVPASAKYVLAADESALYVLTENDRLRGISRSDGSILWTVRPKVLLDAKTGPRSVAGGGRLVIATGKGRVLAVDTADGREVWNIDDQSSIDQAGLHPVLHKDMVLINGATLTARNLSDGTERWAKSITVDGMLQPSGPLSSRTTSCTARRARTYWPATRQTAPRSGDHQRATSYTALSQYRAMRCAPSARGRAMGTTGSST